MVIIEGVQSVMGTKVYCFTEQKKFEVNLEIYIWSHQVTKTTIYKAIELCDVQKMSSNIVWLKKHILAAWQEHRDRN